MIRPRQLADSQAGLSSMEFAIIAPLFIVMVLAILELSIVFTLRGLIETHTREVARIGTTGEFQLAGEEDQLTAMLYDRLKGVVFKPANLSITKNAYFSYTEVRDGTVSDADTDSFGNSGDIMEYIVTYDHEFLSPIGALFAMPIMGGDGQNKFTGMTIYSSVFAVTEDY